MDLIGVNTAIGNREIYTNPSVKKVVPETEKIKPDYTLGLNLGNDFRIDPKYTSESTSSSVFEFVDNEHVDKYPSEIKIPDYNNNDSREEVVQLFKMDVARLIGSRIEDIRIKTEGNRIFISLAGSDIKTSVTFKDMKDAVRLLSIAKESPSAKLANFGDKKSQTTLSTGFNTILSDPKNKAAFTQSVTHELFLDGDGTSKLKVTASAREALKNPSDINNLNDINIEYINSDYGSIGLKFNPDTKAFGVDGDCLALNAAVDKLGKDILNGDMKAIGIALGGVTLGYGALLVAKDVLKEEKTFNAPIRTKLYDNGSFSLKTGIENKVTVGNHKLYMNLNTLSLETGEKFASGISSSQNFKYDTKADTLESDLKFNYDGFSMGMRNMYNLKQPQDTTSHVNFGYTRPFTSTLSGNVSYEQDLNNKWQLSNPIAGAGISIRPNEKFDMSLNTKIPVQNKHEVGVAFGANLRF